MIRKEKLVIGWKVASLSPDMASVRYRAMLPLLGLEDKGHECRLFSSSRDVELEGLDILVVVKSFSADDLVLVQQAESLKIPVVLDLCDNIFIHSCGDQISGVSSPAAIFVEMARIAQAVVASTVPLAEIVRNQISENVPVRVIPDGIETESLHSRMTKRLRLDASRERLKYPGRISRSLASLKLCLVELRTTDLPMLMQIIKARSAQRYRAWKVDQYRRFRSIYNRVVYRQTGTHDGEGFAPAVDGVEPKRILWFGNHGAPHAKFGMLDILSIREPLAKIAREQPLELVVVSNNIDKYNKNIRQLDIPTQYIEWSADTIDKIVAESDVVVIPDSLDNFSLCDSPNRAVMALRHGTPVVATLTPTLNELSECIVLDDFEHGIRAYLNDPGLGREHVRSGRVLIEKLFGQEVVSNKWVELLTEVLGAHSCLNTSLPPELIIAIQMPQDIDLAFPVLEAAKNSGIRCAIWSNVDAVNKWPQLMDAITKAGVPYKVLPDLFARLNSRVFSKEARMLLSISESNLNPHRFTYRLAKIANLAGLCTATVQHGFENIGLTYSDAEQNIRRIKFASNRIYTWAGPGSYHPEIPARTRIKCVPAGCPKPELAPVAEIMKSLPGDRPLIGIFENLHWSRYSEQYRKFFIDSVSQLAQACPEVVFLIKPHGAGRWLTSRYQDKRPQAENLRIIDPADPAWMSVTAPQMLGGLAAVITTPSTVAIDALRQGLPVAVVRYDLELENYRPLPMLDNSDDWSAYVREIMDPNMRASLVVRGRELLERVLIPGNAAQRIVDDLAACSDMKVPARA